LSSKKLKYQLLGVFTVPLIISKLLPNTRLPSVWAGGENFSFFNTERFSVFKQNFNWLGFVSR